MSPQPHEGPAEQVCLPGSVPHAVTEKEQNDCLRRLLSGFSHRCRNSLNGIKMSLYLYRRASKGHVPQCWTEIERSYQKIETLFDHLQLIYRPMTLTMVRGSLGHLIRDHHSKWRASLQSKGMALEVDPPLKEIDGDFDPIQLGIALDAMATWRAEVADSKNHTRISWRTHEGFFEIVWEEFPANSSDLPIDSRGEAGLNPDHRNCARADSLVVVMVSRILSVHDGRLERPCSRSLKWRMHWPLYRSEP